MTEMQYNREVVDSNLTSLTPKQLDDSQNDVIFPLQRQHGKEGNLQTSNKQPTSSLSKEDSPSSIDLAERYLAKNYDFRFNEVLGRLEFKEKSEKAYDFLNDYRFNSIVVKMLKHQIKTTKETISAIINSDFVPIYNPITSYFDSLQEWDGETDYIQQLAETVKTDHDEKWHTWFKKWMVAVVACAIDDSKTNHTAIVFAGKQGIGKTTWMRNLVPISLEKHFYSGIPNLRNKDAKIRLAECFLINLDEMDSLTAANTERLKEIITTDKIKERRPYGHFDETLPRRASFMGSVNNKQFLHDTTGSRRFLCFEANEIDFSHNINMDLVYAQAKQLLKEGFPYFFTGHEIEEIAKQNEQFEAVSHIEEMLLKYLEPVDTEKESPDFKLSATEIGEYLNQKTTLFINDANIQKIGKILKKHNFKRLKHNSSYVYALKEKKGNENRSL